MSRFLVRITVASRAVPERLDTVTVALSRGDVTIGWDTRQALIARLQHVQTRLEPPRHIRSRRRHHRPVELNPAQRATLLGLLEEWALDHDTTTDPAELIELRDALTKDLADLA